MIYLTTHSTHFIYGYMASDMVNEGRRKEMFYLTTHSTHFIYAYMASDIWESERGNLLPLHRLIFPISRKGYLICIIPQTG